MQELLNKLSGVLSDTIAKKQELVFKIADVDAEKAEIARIHKMLNEALEVKKVSLNFRETEIKKVEDVIAFNEEAKRIQVQNKKDLIALKAEENAFIKYREDQIKLLNDRNNQTEDILARVKTKEAQLDAGLKQLAEDKANYKEEVIKKLARNISAEAGV